MSYPIKNKSHHLSICGKVMDWGEGTGGGAPPLSRPPLVQTAPLHGEFLYAVTTLRGELKCKFHLWLLYK